MFKIFKLSWEEKLVHPNQFVRWIGGNHLWLRNKCVRVCNWWHIVNFRGEVTIPMTIGLAFTFIAANIFMLVLFVGRIAEHIAQAVVLISK